MRIAFIDYVFSWPPLGGAPADLYYTMKGLQALGHDVHLFFAAHDPRNWLLSEVQVDTLGFPTTRLDFSLDTFQPARVAEDFRRVVEPWKPDVIFQCFGFFIKPWITKAFQDYPQVCRYYAYEPFCPRDYRLYRNYATCPYNFLKTPQECLRCTTNTFWRVIRTGRPTIYVSEYEDTRAYTPEYHELLIETLGMYRAIIVYNRFTKSMLDPYNPNVHVIGGGVHVSDFAFSPMPTRAAGEKKVVLMSGRADDFSKGMHTMKAAGKILSRERDDFEIRVTSMQTNLETDWFKPIGWHNHDAVVQFYHESDLCVVPSEWEEPFGLVAVEAMASGRPAIVSDVGGLQDIVVHSETGLIFKRGESAQLADCVRQLLDDPKRAAAMGRAGRARVEQEYDWDTVIRRHYPGILEEAVR